MSRGWLHDGTMSRRGSVIDASALFDGPLVPEEDPTDPTDPGGAAAEIPVTPVRVDLPREAARAA